MATLLHIDTSLNGGNSHSRAVTAAFRRAWEGEHPQGRVIHRDLDADPVPHLRAAAYYAGYTAPADQSPEQRAAFALRAELIEEAEAADVILLSAPMYNYSIPSTLKAWIDHVFAVGRTAMTENPSLAGKPAVVVTSRGGSFREGTPQHGNDYVQSYLRQALGAGLGMDVTFIVPELTLAPVVPAMAGLVPLFEASRAESLAAAESHARELAIRLAA
ncbi:FMN-dependent NADH-azoreductase [Streptomyces griseochromogenes]|uniref:FMN dependent NADH:quinone oxidoreductase n=1 Tax=Streptomyces griseochromogenes TaxID=68214 RepID=A0A1B1BAW4_9ACTN|nr:NAD(P)H-dependent oxidoreductase [Streptomyces griseochromogenes]ANP55937.1 FMN-dependent NADH-azoreductase [Streptomyces griseochromogenes]MBP2054766.1 FMN-dependent NADH-azoreductase [Streptomyces griseochromogenes]